MIVLCSKGSFGLGSLYTRHDVRLCLPELCAASVRDNFEGSSLHLAAMQRVDSLFDSCFGVGSRKDNTTKTKSRPGDWMPLNNDVENVATSSKQNFQIQSGCVEG